jgi:hypothetical protein
MPQSENKNFKEWQQAVMQRAKLRLNQNQNRNENHKNSIIHLNESQLSILRRKFVFTKVDKACQNYAIICKFYYHNLLKQEIGYTRINGNEQIISDVYEQVAGTAADVILKSKNEQSNLGIVVEVQHMSLPYIYFLPKFHKNPVKFRSIVASTNTVTQTLSKKLLLALKVVNFRIKNYCATVEKCTKVNGYWRISNNTPILETLEKISAKRTAKTINTYDFSTLYTSIDHGDLFNALQYIVELAYSSSRHKNIVVYSTSAKWTNSDISTALIVSCNRLMELLRYLVSNTYIRVGNLVVRQKRGIPMGTNAAPEIADLYLNITGIEIH